MLHSELHSLCPLSVCSSLHTLPLSLHSHQQLTPPPSAQVVAPTIQNPSCQDQLIEAAKEVARAVEAVVQECQLGCRDEGLSRELGLAATDVTRALNDLLNHIK